MIRVRDLGFDFGLIFVLLDFTHDMSLRQFIPDELRMFYVYATRIKD